MQHFPAHAQDRQEGISEQPVNFSPQFVDHMRRASGSADTVNGWVDPDTQEGKNIIAERAEIREEMRDVISKSEMDAARKEADSVNP